MESRQFEREINRGINSPTYRTPSEDRLSDLIRRIAAEIECTTPSCIVHQPTDKIGTETAEEPDLSRSEDQVVISTRKKRYANLYGVTDHQREFDIECATACADQVSGHSGNLVKDAKSCIEHFCWRTYHPMPASDSVREVSVAKRWSSRVCMETHCRPHEKDAQSYIACGMTRCG